MTEEPPAADAFGAPGIEPRWTHGGKDGVGTAYHSASRVWFTLWNGILTEAYYPTIDRAQLRDLQYLVTDGATFFHEEKRHLTSTTEPLSKHGLAYQVVSDDPGGRYRIVKQVISDPHLPCILQRTRIEADADLRERLRLYALCAPHLEGGGRHNNAWVREVGGRNILVAEKRGTWLALAATIPFGGLSVGYVGRSDGWTDLATDHRLDWTFDRALDGNVALTGELPGGVTDSFTLGVAFGASLEAAATTLFQCLAEPFVERRKRYNLQWSRPFRGLEALEQKSGDDGLLFRRSVSLLLAHEDKTFPGALIASLSIPWGETRSDDDEGGYHLVWTRDLVNSAGGLLAAGHRETARRALIYLSVAQRPDGGFPQNFWIDGRPYWQGIQLDEVAFPIMLAWRLWRADCLGGFDPYFMVRRAAAFLVRYGPATEQDRWEEASGYSPSTLASSITALVCAADFLRDRGDEASAVFLEEYADFLECHVEAWTVTNAGTLDPDTPRHYIRIHPVDVDDPTPPEDPDHGTLILANRPPGSQYAFPAPEIVDAGFLELVRYGVRRAGTQLMEDSLRVVDRVLRVETTGGPVWRRYNHDGYGQRDDGGPFIGWGTGRAWPLLTGERGHYELEAGRDPAPFIRAIESFACRPGLLPEQVWDREDRSDIHMFLGRATGAAMPLMWAHAEYLKLLRSARDRMVFDRFAIVSDRYLGDRRACRRLEIWKPNRQARAVAPGFTLRIQAPHPFRLRWTMDEWDTARDTDATATGLGLQYVDLAVPLEQRAPVRFTFFYPERRAWAGRDYRIDVAAAAVNCGPHEAAAIAARS